jgi:hypothetical protein
MNEDQLQFSVLLSRSLPPEILSFLDGYLFAVGEEDQISLFVDVGGSLTLCRTAHFENRPGRKKTIEDPSASTMCPSDSGGIRGGDAKNGGLSGITDS